MTQTLLRSETAYAKINLALHVRRLRDDGYHDLETMFAFASHGDCISVVPDDEISLTLSGPFAPSLGAGTDNLVVRAARALRERFGIKQGARLHLEKNLPVASGIGGGSADAAATLRLLAKLWSLEKNDDQIFEIARKLGADVPACLASRTQFGDGVGDHLVTADMPRLDGVPILLVNPLVPLSTADVFARWDGIDRGGLARNESLNGRNDLTAAAIALVPEIATILRRLETMPYVRLARMSGSGATCFALFETVSARDVAESVVKAELPATWCMASTLR